MPMFRRMPGKPVEVRQWTLNDGDAFKIDDYPMVKFDHSTGRCYIETMHAGQRVNLEKGDWILPEPDGVHFYPCKPDIFVATYEAVASGEAKERAFVDALAGGLGITRVEVSDILEGDNARKSG